MTHGVPLIGLRRGDRALIVGLDPAPHHLRKLMALGILPGMTVAVLQHFPCHVVEVGNSRLALDHDIARAVLVKK